MADTAYQQLIYKLDAFIRKYYKNQVIRGIIYTVGALAVFFLLTNLVEFFGHLGMLGRAILFYGYLIVAFGILIQLIIIPLIKLNRLGKVLSYEAASEIIGKHFSEVRDKLINTLQLNQQLSFSYNFIEPLFTPEGITALHKIMVDELLTNTA